MSLTSQSRRAPPSSFVALVLAGHSALGLLFVAVIYVLCLTGTLAVFANELRHWERPDGPVVLQATPVALDHAVQAGYERAREIDAVGDLFVRAPRAGSPRLLVQLTDQQKSGADETWLAAADGSLVTSLSTPWYDFLIALHYQLLVPGLVGAHSRRHRRALYAVVDGLGRARASAHLQRRLYPALGRLGAFLQEADIHDRLSVWGLPFHLVIAFTGASLGLGAIIVTLLTNATHAQNAPRAFEALLRSRPDRRSPTGAAAGHADHLRHPHR